MFGLNIFCAMYFLRYNFQVKNSKVKVTSPREAQSGNAL